MCVGGWDGGSGRYGIQCLEDKKSSILTIVTVITALHVKLLI